MAILHQYRSKGACLVYGAGVVALDDAVGIIIFALAAMAVVDGSLAAGVVEAGYEIGAALLSGVGLGAVLARGGRRIQE